MWEIIAQEFREMVRSRRSVPAILFGVPLVFTLLFGLVYSANAVKHIPLVAYDQDGTAVSRALVQAFADSERYDMVGQVTTQEELDRFLRNNQAMAAVVIPENFSRDAKLSRSASVMIETNGANLTFANNVISSSTEILQTFSAGTGQKLLEGINQPPAQALRTVAPVRLSLRIVDNPTLAYSNFVLPGMSVNGVQIAIYLVASTLLTAEYAAWLRRRVPVRDIILGKLLPCWLLSVAACLLAITLLVVCFQVPFRGSALQLAAICGAFCFAVSAFGIFISAVTAEVLPLMQNAAMYIMCSFLCCGYSWPQFAMNSFGRAIAPLFPITYAAATIRDIMLAAPPSDLLANCVILVAYGSVFCLLAALLLAFRRRQQQGTLEEVRS